MYTLHGLASFAFGEFREYISAGVRYNIIVVPVLLTDIADVFGGPTNVICSRYNSFLTFSFASFFASSAGGFAVSSNSLSQIFSSFSFNSEYPNMSICP